MPQIRRSTPDIAYSSPCHSFGTPQLLAMDDAVALGDDQWSMLRGPAALASPFTGWAWHDAWNATATRAERNAAVVVASYDTDRRLTALLPLARRHVVHRKIPAVALIWAIHDVGSPDHLDMLATVDADIGAIAAGIDALDWDLLRLDGLVSDGSGIARLRAALRARGIETTLQRQWPCPYIDLPDSWEAYLATRSRSRRAAILRRERGWMAEASPAVRVYAETDMHEGWRRLVQLHGARWRADSTFEPRARLLHQYFLMHVAARRQLWLATLEVDGAALAVWYGFSDGETLYFYQGGRAAERSDLGAGSVLLGVMIRRAIALGLRRFDFLRGDEPYKYEWATGTRWTNRLIGFRRTARGQLLHAAEWLGAARERHRSPRESAPAFTAARGASK